MKVVIDIPEEVYESAKNGTLNEIQSMYICGSVVEGTPLPKRHGRLIDADEIQFERTEFETYGDYCIAFDAIDTATPIIEADKGAEND